MPSLRSLRVKHHEKKILLGTLTPIATCFGLTGCGGADDDCDRSDEEALGVEELFAQLQEEIDDLKKQLEEATGVRFPAIEDALNAAEGPLPECLNLGDCRGFVEAGATLASLTDAICEQGFSCYSDAETQATLGAACGDLEGSVRPVIRRL